MNRISLLILVLFSAFVSNAETDSLSDGSHSTRKYQLHEIVPEEGLKASPLIEVFQGMKPDQIREVYSTNKSESDSLLVAKQLNPVWWRSALYQAGNFFRQKNLTPKQILSMLTPVLLMALAGITIAWMITILILPSGISPAERPETDQIAAVEVDSVDESMHEEE